MAEIKERLVDDQNEQNSEQLGRQNEKPTEVLIDLKKDVIIPREVQSWMEKVEQDPAISGQNQIKGDDDSVLQTIAPAVVKVSLPTNKKVFSEGFNKTVGDAGRWLSEFVFRLIKKNKGNVKFNEE
ncbi:MAG: hypothetical protein PHO75_00175 [Candidatus Shapirobacteria bacterium]|nr:hypothetical protein [Candidatus Shapirobacteria bacterium]